MIPVRFLKTHIGSAFTLALALATGFQVGAEPVSSMKATPTQANRIDASAGVALAKPGLSSIGDLEVSRLVINIPSRTLWVYAGDKIIRFFPVGVGRVGFSTPMGKFSVIRKVMDPGWENPYLASGEMRLAPGETNPLGTRWIGFYQKAGGEYGMHGTDNPESVGKFSSHGCVRLKVPDAEALFEMVEVGTPVEVVYQPVLVRRHGNQVRVVVYNDRFRRGMPSVSKVKADILKQYPKARVDVAQLQTALRQHAEKPVTVGQIPIEAESTSEAAAIPASGTKPGSSPTPSGLQPIESLNSTGRL